MQASWCCTIVATSAYHQNHKTVCTPSIPDQPIKYQTPNQATQCGRTHDSWPPTCSTTTTLGCRMLACEGVTPCRRCTTQMQSTCLQAEHLEQPTYSRINQAHLYLCAVAASPETRRADGPWDLPPARLHTPCNDSYVPAAQN